MGVLDISDDEVPEILEHWGMQITPSLPLLGVVAPDSPIYGSNKTIWHWTECKQMLNWFVWNKSVWSFNCV